MAGSIDYARLRDQTLGSAQEEEAVTVNTRALIDKVLARYSGEWTTFRELIQNAADAAASKVSIKFETIPSSTVPTPSPTADNASERLKHVVLHHTVRRVVVTNNGQPFDDNDWARLKRIAEGNPDETKIGAFGVGFYSVFADCESPFVTSGKETMAFYWKGNSLFTRKGRLPPDHKTSETCFVLDYRNTTSALPNLLSICQFLSTSLTFIKLEQIDLWLDEWNIFSLAKKSAPSTAVTIPKDIETKTKQGMMRITGVDCQNAQIDASWTNIVGWTPSSSEKSPSTAPDSEMRSPPSLRSFFSRLTGSSHNNAANRRAAKEEEVAQQAISEDLMGQSSATVFIRVNTVQVKSQVSSSFANELQRATKKPPPKQTHIAVLTSSYDETSASMSTLTGTAAKKAAEIITSVLPSRSGRIFIGFPTAQTTGLLAHISAPSLIPTVERENIDLNARWVRDWNSELLNIAGIACRVAYAGEMSVLRAKLASSKVASPNAPLEESEIAALYPAAIHTLKQYTFRESTPLARAGQLIEESFWTCNKNAWIEMFSSRGILPSHDIRIASEDLSFVNRIPVIPETLMTEAREFVTRLQDFGLISDITTTDIRRELEKQALSEQQLIEFLKWSSHKVKINELDGSAISSLFNVTVANIGDASAASEHQTILALSSIKTFLNSHRISPENPVPPHTIPFRFTKNLGQIEMQSFGWDELQIVPWIRWLLDSIGTKGFQTEKDITASPQFAAQILGVLSKNWDSLSQSSRTTVIELFATRTVIPTKLGMKKPSDAYFTSVKLFDDLPTISGLTAVKEKFLKALGVRKTIELKVIFERLMRSSSDSKDKEGTGWSHIELIRYLVSVWSDIPQEDIAQLQATALCPAEKDGDPKQTTTRKYKVSELFEPKDSLRALGLPILQWPGVFNMYSSEGKFLRLLGLRLYPSLPELVEIMIRANTNKNKPLYNTCLNYFIENHYQNNYGSFDLKNIQAPFLPLENGEPYQLVKPEDCFTDSKAEVLLYPILRKDLQPHGAKFGVRPDPPMAECAARLIRRPPQSRADARRLFGYFAGRLTDISDSVTQKLGSSAIVPLVSSKSNGSKDSEKPSAVRLVTPTSCFLGDGQDYGDIFDYVDFGQEANVFLLKVGSKHEPSITEIAKLIVQGPTRILQILGSERYKDLLRRLHMNMSALKRDKLLWKEMKTVAFLLAYKEVPVNKSSKKSRKSFDQADDDDPADDGMAVQYEWRLRSAERIVISDDFFAFTLFREHLAVAPQEDALEEFYFSLGSPLLSSQVQEEARLGPRTGDQHQAQELRELIFERARLFLHEQNASSVRHDVKWLEKNLEVQHVQSISLRRTLRGQNVSHTEKRSAFVTTGQKSQSILSITTSPDTWQISHGVVQLLIDRPKTQTTMIFETFLVTPLLKLRARGYNVDRILRKRAENDAKQAEFERQRQAEFRKQQEEEQRRLDDLERNRAPMPQTAITAREESEREPREQPRTPKQPSMPGAFDDSPDHVSGERALTHQSSTKQKTPQNFFTNLTRSLGLDNNATTSNAAQHLQSMFRSATAAASGTQSQGAGSPPPYYPQNPNQTPQPPAGERVTPSSRIDQNLSRAITASRPYGSSTLFSRPETNAIKEVASYCDTRPAQNLTLLGTTPAPTATRVFATPDTASDGTDFLERNAPGLAAFAALLAAAGSVFPLPRDTLHIFHDPAGGTIAFNSQGSVFCNYRFFAQLHLAAFAGGEDAAAGQAQARTDALVYWWVTICHELAHNLVADHSSNHSYYTEQFVARYFPRVAGLVLGAGGGVAADPGAAGDSDGAAASEGRLLL